MAITATERSQIVELTVLMFNAAPGAEYLSQIVSIYETNGRSLQTLADILAGTSAYTSLNPNTQTAEAFADAFLTPLGLQNDALARDFVIAKMNAGVSKGAIAYEAYVALNSVPDSANNQYSAANAILNNKVAVAVYYSVDRAVAATDLASLQAALVGVTADPATVTSAKAAIDATIDFTLSASAASVNEGSSITVHLTNGAPNTEYVLRVDSAHASDVGSQLTMVTTDANGTAHATIAVTADRVTEGAETLTISVVGQTSVSTTVTVNDTSMNNTAPAITAEASLAANEGKSATFNLAAADAEGDAVTLSASAASGTVVDNGNGTFTYTPNAGFSGSDTITVTAADALGATSTQTIAVNVDANDAPIAQAGGDAANEGGAAVSGQLVATDADAGDALTFSLNAPVEGLTLNADGSYTFDPSANTAANALVYSDSPLAIVANYTVTDSLGATSQSTLTITVTPKPLTFTLTKAGTSVQEGASQDYVVTASEAVTSPVDVTFTLLPGDGSAGNTGTGNTNTADFATGSFNPVTTTIAAGSATATFTVTPVNDATTELPEAFTVQAQVAGSTFTLGGTTVDATTAGGVGQTFTLTTSIDTIPGLIGSANSAGTDGNDTIVALVDKVTTANTTLNALDSINGGLGTNAMNLNFVGNGTNGDPNNELLAIPAGVTISNVQTLNIRAAGDVGEQGTANSLDLSGQTFSTVNVTTGNDVAVKAATTTDVNYSGLTGVLEVDGGNNVTITDATADQAIAVGAATKAAGNVTITDSNQGTGGISAKADGVIIVTASKQGAADITTVGGTDTTITASSTVTSGNIVVGDTTAATGAVVVTENVTSDGTAAVGTGNITTNGGTTVAIDVNAISSAKDKDADADITVGTITVNAGSSTTAVAINQNDTVTTVKKAAVAVVGATQTLKFGALTAGQTTIVGGLTFTAAKALTAAEVAAAFANLTEADTQSSGGLTANGSYTGTLAAGWTSGAASGDTVVFTAATDAPGAMTVTDGAVDPTSTYVAGTASAGADESTNTVVFGNVVVNEGGTASVTYVGINGYAGADLGNTGADLNALTTLSLADSAGAANVATSATTLALTVNDVNDAVSLDAAGAATVATLNLTATGKDSAFALTAAAVKTLAVSGDKAVSLTADLDALETVTVSGSAGLTLAAAAANTIKSINTTGTTGTVTATIEGARATYTGGAGKDVVTLATDTVITKAISLGAGDDTLSFGALTVTGTTAALAGGDGTDTLSMSVAAADALDNTTTFAAQISGFERLTINNAGAGGETINLANLGFTNYVTTTGSGGTLTLNNLASNGTVVITTAPTTGFTVGVKDAGTGTADVLNVVLSNAGDLAAGTVTAANVETVNVTATDTTTPFTAVDSLTLTADKATTVNVAGNAALNLTLTGSTLVTLVDGSSMTGALKASTAVSAAAATINGGSGADDLTAAHSQDVLVGNAGADKLTVLDDANLVSLSGGAGKDTYVIGEATNSSGYATIQGTAAELSGDVIQFDAAITDFSAAKIVLADTAVFQDYANEATKGDAAVVGEVAWFQFGGNTYVVQDNSASASFDNGVDAIVKIVGLVNFSFNDAGATGTLEIV